MYQILPKSSKLIKTEKISEKTSTKFQSTISNVPNLDQNVKNTVKSKRYISNVPKAAYFSKKICTGAHENYSKS